ncbi:MAG: hypothetical protein U9R17_09995 [Thermodesulfobacteriota bacterium]|nr:hypothetical protein [Thermodesulfobacteriota bacterium]
MAMPFRKKVIIFIILGALFYLLLSYHIIIIGEGANFRLLKKSTYTLEYTIFSTKGKMNRKILAIDILREDGIGNLLIEEGLMSEEEQEIILERLNIE